LKDPQTYHYALHISPKEESIDPTVCETTKHQCKNILQVKEDTVTISWVYEVVNVNPNHDNRILVRVLLGEVNRSDAAENFADVPVIQDNPNFTCVTWVRQALLRLNQARAGGKGIILDWGGIQKTALTFVGMKKQQGRFETGWKGDSSRIPTFNMISGKEI
jgi:hypothetical protein